MGLLIRSALLNYFGKGEKDTVMSKTKIEWSDWSINPLQDTRKGKFE